MHCHDPALGPPTVYPSHAHLNLYNLYAYFENKFRVGDGFWLLLEGNLVSIILAFLFSQLLSNYCSTVKERTELLQDLDFFIGWN
jgi:hypothetical protein